VDKNIKLDAKKMMDINALPNAMAMGSIPAITNPFKPLNNVMTPVTEAGKGISTAMKSLTDILG
jgi:hypothetical protein